MFENEAEKHADGIYHYKINVSDYGEGGIINYRYSDIKEAYQKGAEFGYNKANEWHYVKDGDLPKGLPKPVLVAFHNKFSDKIVIDIARYSLELNKWWFIHDLKDLEEDVIAWKEIVLPELKESE